MQAEIQALHANKTWTLVHSSSHMNLVTNKWVFKVKTQVDGSIKHYKTHLVARGFTQLMGLDYDETFSPFVKPATIQSIWLILTLALSHGWSLKQLNVSNDFLHEDLQEKVFLTQSPDFEDPDHFHYVCQLHKALYGLKQAPRAWYLKFSNYIQQLFSVFLMILHYFFNYKTLKFSFIYVDDIILIKSSSSTINKLISHLSTVFHIKDLGDLHFFLGVQIAQD